MVTIQGESEKPKLVEKECIKNKIGWYYLNINGANLALIRSSYKHFSKSVVEIIN